MASLSEIIALFLIIIVIGSATGLIVSNDTRTLQTDFLEISQDFQAIAYINNNSTLNQTWTQPLTLHPTTFSGNETTNGVFYGKKEVYLWVWEDSSITEGIDNALTMDVWEQTPNNFMFTFYLNDYLSPEDNSFYAIIYKGSNLVNMNNTVTTVNIPIVG